MEIAQSLLGSQAQAIESRIHGSSPQTAADACADFVSTVGNAIFALLRCAVRRFFESGAQTTRQDTVQSIGIEHVLLIVRSIASSLVSICSNEVQSSSDFLLAALDDDVTAGTTIIAARAHVAHRAPVMERIGVLRT